jgi:mono/diheme cytochrome c family protein
MSIRSTTPTPGRVLVAATLATAALVLSACGSGRDAPVAEAGSGQALFEANCAECHGERALGDGPMAGTLPVQPPSLLEHLGHHPQAQLVDLIRSGVPPAMPPAPLTEEEVLLVIEHAWTLVPDSMVDELREMQRMAEMGMDMSGMQLQGGPEMSMDPMGDPSAMPNDSAGHAR